MGEAYLILATLGPATADEAAWQALLEAGAGGFRLNTSHLTLATLEGWLERLAGFQRKFGFAVTLDLQGSKWRLGTFPPFGLVQGAKVELILAEHSDQPGRLPVPHVDFFRAAPHSNGEIVLNDAKSRLAIETGGADRLTARVIQPGEIAPRKGITFTAADFRVEALGAKDGDILRRTAGLDFVRYAVSYIKDAAEMANYRRMYPGRPLIAKIERRPAVGEAEEIARFADELWLCRGDLGAELGLPGMAAAAHRFARCIRRLPVPALLAGQVLEHMSEHPTPTRAEACALYDALQQGYAGVVLSDETAVGRYPRESVQMAAMFHQK
ncbi:MAG: pyruvate kinase [Chloroflexota bacterium]